MIVSLLKKQTAIMAQLKEENTCYILFSYQPDGNNSSVTQDNFR